jgi:hypothetical protein
VSPGRRLRPRLVAGTVLACLGAAAATPHAGADAQPVLGFADREMVIMGGATQGAPGEVWGYRRLPLDIPPLPDPDQKLGFAPIASALTPDPQLVFTRVTDETGGWVPAETPVGATGRPLRGVEPNRRSARITPKAGGVLVGRDPLQSGDARVTVLARDPGGRFRALPLPGEDVLSAEEDGLATDGGTGRVAIAAVDGARVTELFAGVLGPAVEDGVAHWDGASWTREPVEVPPSSQAGFRILAIDATSPENAWMLARTDSSLAEGVVLLQRQADPTSPVGFRWRKRDLQSPVFSQEADTDAGTSGLAVFENDAQPLTVTPGGAWIDGSLRGGGTQGDQDFTLFYSREAARVTTSYCDVQRTGGGAVCDKPLGFRFGRRGGYRSFAFGGDGPGRRIITGPLEVGGGEETNLGSYIAFDGTSFARRSGAGGNLRPSGGFSAFDDGWLEGPVEVTGAAPPAKFTSWPVSVRTPFTAVATAPGQVAGAPGAQAISVGAFGGVARHLPGAGWQREFLLTATGAVTSPTLRGVAWPEPGRAYAVGDVGAMWLWRADTGLWERDPAAPVAFDGNLMGVAFDPLDANRGFAVGRDGVLLSYDKTWTQQPLPAGYEGADLTAVAYAGREALVAAGRGVLIDSGTGFKEDPSVRRILDAAPATARIFTVAALPDGGAVAAGRDIVLVRDAPGGEWRQTAAPLPGATVTAAAATRPGPVVRAVVAVAPDADYPAPTVLPPPDPNVPPPVLPPFALPGDGYVLHETDRGWRDEQRTDFVGTQNDRPLKSDPVLAFSLGPDGRGWAVGGWSGQPDNAGRGTGASGPGTVVRQRVQTTLISRYAPDGTPEGPPGVAGDPLPLDTGLTTFAVAGHAACDLPCARLASQGLGPDRNARAVVDAVSALAARPGGPRAVLYTGGRLPTSGTQKTGRGELDRLAEVLGGGGAGVPVFGAVSAADVADGDSGGFQGAFSKFPAPFGTGGRPANVSVDDIPAGATPAAGARTHYAYDTAGDGGRVRVVVIDNARGSLADSDPHQNPPEPQEPWLREVLADAKRRGVPAIVMGSRDLNTRLVPRSNVASDGDRIAQLLVDNGASAYVHERPEEQRASQIPAGATTTIPEYGTGTLGYRSPIANATTPGSADSLFGDSGYLLLSISAGQRDQATNRAPVTVRFEPLIQGLSLAAVDGTLLRRSRPALFQGLGRRPLGGDRWGPISAADGSPNPSGSDPYTSFPPAPCLQANCASRVTAEYTFASSDPDIADFVRPDPASANLRKPLQDAKGKVVTDAVSGLLCAFNPGTTTVTVAAGGLSFTQKVTVLGGSVQQPCGTRPLNPSRFKAPVAVAPAAPPAPAPAPAANPAPSPSPAPPPPPPPPPPTPPAAAAAPPASKPPLKAPPARPAPLAPQPPVVPPPVPNTQARAGVPGAPPPPAGGFGRPIPPGGAVARVFEEKREEEVAPEQSQAFSAYDADDRAPVPSYLLGVVLLAALAGASIRIDYKRRRRYTEVAHSRVSAAPITPTPRNRYRSRR